MGKEGVRLEYFGDLGWTWTMMVLDQTDVIKIKLVWKRQKICTKRCWLSANVPFSLGVFRNFSVLFLICNYSLLKCKWEFSVALVSFGFYDLFRLGQVWSCFAISSVAQHLSALSLSTLPVGASQLQDGTCYASQWPLFEWQLMALVAWDSRSGTLFTEFLLPRVSWCWYWPQASSHSHFPRVSCHF